MDIRMRGIDGIAVLERIRSDSRPASVPVMALTANAMLGDREKYLASGFENTFPNAKFHQDRVPPGIAATRV